MHRIRDWLYIGKYAETTHLHYLLSYRIGAMLQLADRVEQPGIESLYLPVEDGIPLKSEAISRGVEFIRQQEAGHRVVLSACGAGISRSVAFAIAALKEEENLSLVTALRIVRNAHPEAMPHPALWQSLSQYYGEEVNWNDLAGKE